MAVKYRIPLSDKEALGKLAGNKNVVSWNVVLPDGFVEVDTNKEVEGLEDYKA